MEAYVENKNQPFLQDIVIFLTLSFNNFSLVLHMTTTSSTNAAYFQHHNVDYYIHYNKNETLVNLDSTELQNRNVGFSPITPTHHPYSIPSINLLFSNMRRIWKTLTHLWKQCIDNVRQNNNNCRYTACIIMNTTWINVNLEDPNLWQRNTNITIAYLQVMQSHWYYIMNSLAVLLNHQFDSLRWVMTLTNTLYTLLENLNGTTELQSHQTMHLQNISTSSDTSFSHPGHHLIYFFSFPQLLVLNVTEHGFWKIKCSFTC